MRLTTFSAQTQGLEGCLWWSAAFVLAAALLSFGLPEVKVGEVAEKSDPN
jgi:hypothetical protein